MAPVEKAWAVQILDGPEDVLQKARLLKVRNKVRLWRTRQRSTGNGTSEKLPFCRQPMARPRTLIRVRVGIPGQERRRLAKRKRGKRPCKRLGQPTTTPKFNRNKNERSCCYPTPVFFTHPRACAHMFLRLGGVWLSAAFVRGQLP